MFTVSEILIGVALCLVIYEAVEFIFTTFFPDYSWMPILFLENKKSRLLNKFKNKVASANDLEKLSNLLKEEDEQLEKKLSSGDVDTNDADRIKSKMKANEETQYELDQLIGNVLKHTYTADK